MVAVIQIATQRNAEDAWANQRAVLVFDHLRAAVGSVSSSTVERRAGQTPATRLGDGLPALAALLAAAAALALPRREQPEVEPVLGPA